MRDRIVSDKYADALLATAKKQGSMDLIAGEILQLQPFFLNKSPLQRFLEGPQITNDQKYALFKKTFENRISTLLYQFLIIVLRKHRIDLIGGIFSEYLRLVDIERGIQEANVTTVIALDSEILSRLQAKLEQLTHKKIRLHPKVDSKILGGVVINIDNTQIDGSFRTQLTDLREKLMNIKVN